MFVLYQKILIHSLLTVDSLIFPNEVMFSKMHGQLHTFVVTLMI